MNKKGFTLIELLAVIAILAILIVIAVPDIMELFNDSKKKALVSQAQLIYKTAEQQIIANSYQYPNQSISKFYSESANDYEKLNLDGNDVMYCLYITNGKVSSFKISDNNNSITIDPITSIMDIDIEDLSDPIASVNFSCD